METGRSAASRHGFTLIELLIVIAVISILAGLLLPALATAKSSAARVRCLGNQRQLAITWQLYADDNLEHLVPNGHTTAPAGPVPRSTTTERFWVLGDNHFFLPAYTNTAFLIDARYAAFADYVKEAAIYRCPADRRRFARTAGIPTAGTIQNRPYQIRSYALNASLGWAMPGPSPHPFRVLAKTSDLSNVPGPRIQFLDINPANLCYPSFILGSASMYFHIPSSLHRGSGVISFTDGHVEARRWYGPPLTRQARDSEIIAHSTPVGDARDRLWLAERISAPQ